MDALDLFFKKYAYKFPKGYPDMNNEQDINILADLLEGLGVNLNEEDEQEKEKKPDYDTEILNLLTTLSTNALPYRFIGISGFDIVGRDVSSGVRRRSSMLKGTYTQAFYVGDQIQLATNAPQLIENNEKLDELILKVDTAKDPLTLPQFLALK